MTDARRDRIWQILDDEGRSQTWLARRTGYTTTHINRLRMGTHPTTARFRALCAAVLGRPESDLFHVSEPTPEPNGTERDDSDSNDVPTLVNIVDGTVYLSNDPHEDVILARVLVGGDERR